MLPLGAYSILFQSMISFPLVSGRQLGFGDSALRQEPHCEAPLRRDPEPAVGQCHTRVWCHIPGSMQEHQEVAGLGSLIMAKHQQNNSGWLVSHIMGSGLEYVLEGMVAK